ncbi:MAG: carbohydrate ABC transporter permease [Hamadaea sp.]|uniref:carbohydrate ABC transporter permease n=1 Tax=Hamadaea sp. TaxID=2024425 RepID=UPI0017F7C568|nr:carbohydrate ABC transporter permease [Hamadaea sp.]NUR74231.1 carbohydrate ABC transporter permease [Hamadaea sp.]NUT22259.1 carbohydrate ABC transporter permease [Hamadaea sp.]
MTTNTTPAQDRLAASASPAARTAAGRQKREIRLFSRLSSISLMVWSVIILGPLIWVFLSSFKSPEEIFSSPWTLPAKLRWDNWGRAWNTAHIGTYMINSVIVVAISTVGTMLLGSMAAYVLARYKFFGNRFIYYLFVSGLAFPVFLALVPLFFVVRDLGLLGTKTGLILVYISYSLPFTVFFLSAFFKTLPTSVAEAAMIDGAGHVKLFFRVMMPMAKSGLISVGIFNVIGQWAQYLLPVYLVPGGYEKNWVLTQGIAEISTQAGFKSDWGALFAAITIAILPMILIYAVMQRQIQAGLTAGAVK